MTDDDDLLAEARAKWSNTGSIRPPFADDPGVDQESVWDYPRPPAVVPDARLVVVGTPDDPLASTRAAIRVLETASPPTWYIPTTDVDSERLTMVEGTSLCEWKGHARYWALRDGPSTPVAWDYPAPFDDYATLVDHLAFYPGRIECRVEGERVRTQTGGFYGGWITDEIVGPFKGDPGTGAW